MTEKKQQPAYPLRMPSEMRERLEAAAREEKRSLNAEILARLERSFSAQEADKAADETDSEAAPEPESGRKISVRVNKERLLSEEGTPLTEERLSLLMNQAISQALDSVLGGEGRGPARPTKGPAPRKRFPKES